MTGNLLASVPEDLTALRVSNGALKGEALPTRLHLMKWGENPSTRGIFLVGAKTEAVLLSNQRKLGFERVPIDFDHCTCDGSPEYVKGQPKAIFGYGRPAVVKGEGLFLEDVTWTPLGVKEARNYEDLSPAAHFDSSGELDFLKSVALTPNGSLHEVTFFSASTNKPQTKEENMNKFLLLSAVALAMGLPQEASEEQVSGELKKLSTLGARLQALESAEAPNVTALAARLEALEKKEAPKIPDVTTLTARIEALETKIKEDATKAAEGERTRLIQLLSAEGKSPVNPITGKAYTAEELKALDVTLLSALRLNTPSTVPLNARHRMAGEGAAADSGLKGRSRMVAAFEKEKTSRV